MESFTEYMHVHKFLEDFRFLNLDVEVIRFLNLVANVSLCGSSYILNQKTKNLL